MKKTMLKKLSFIVCVTLAVTAACIGAPFKSAAQGEYSVGDIFEFGSYPQSKVSDNALISSLDGVAKTWISYSYLSGSGSEGTMSESDYMKYCDISYGGEKYRAVTFTAFRPRQTYMQAAAKSSFVDDNGYSEGSVYYFRFEPIKWKILDPETGLMVSQSIIDSQPYSRFIYINGTDSNGAACYSDADFTNKACKYLPSSVRSFLNGDFYGTAFTPDEQSQIESASLVNDSFNKSWQIYASDDSRDKIFLLSYADVQNTAYGFSGSTAADAARVAEGTDYAKIQGLQTDETGSSPWWLRSAGNTSRNASFADYSGYTGTGSAEYTDKGIRPAIKCTAILESSSHTVSFDYDGGTGNESQRTVDYGARLGTLPAAVKPGYAFEGWFTSKEGNTAANPAQIIKADIALFARWSVCEHSFELIETKQPTCISGGYNKFKCGICGYEKTEILKLTEHTPAPFVIENSTASTCNEAGEYDEVTYCSVCSVELSREHKIKELGAHIPLEAVKENETPASCTSGGNYESAVYCGICGEELSREYKETDPIGHDLIHHEGKPSDCKEHGFKDYDTCSRCDYNTYEELPLAAHTPLPAVKENEILPTCTQSGKYDSVVYCSVCAEELSRETVSVSPVGHSDKNNDGVCDICGEIYDRQKYDDYKSREAAKNIKLGIDCSDETAVKFGRSVELHPVISDKLPEGYTVVWNTEGEGFELSETSDGLILKSVSRGETAVKLKLIGPDGKPVTDDNGKDVEASITLKSKAGFFDMLFDMIFRFFAKLFDFSVC